MNASKFAEFSAAYRTGLLQAVLKNPDRYRLRPGDSPASYASEVAEKMLDTIQHRGLGAVSFTSNGFRNACKTLGIKHTGKAIRAFLES